jgi:hypothetical protein
MAAVGLAFLSALKAHTRKLKTVMLLYLNMPETVNHPDHYNAGAIECIDAIEAALTPEEFAGFCKGNAIKYLWRMNHKGGRESLAKARWYVNRLFDKP